jgi:hypothetical protein
MHIYVFRLGTVLGLLAAATGAFAAGALTVAGLRTEWLDNPEGIDAAQPRPGASNPPNAARSSPPGGCSSPAARRR